MLCLLLIRCDSLTLRVTCLCRAHHDLRGIDAGDDEGRTLFDESAFALDLDGASANLRVADEGQTGQGHATLADDDGELVDGCTDNEVFFTIYNPAAYLGVSSEEYDAMEDVEAFYRKESMEDSDFREIVADLTEKINAVIESL